MRGTKFLLWDEKTLYDSVLYELDQLQEFDLEITPEGKYISHGRK
jgi:hypothetical protein